MELYVARDKDGALFLYLNEPVRDVVYYVFQGTLANGYHGADWVELPKDKFPSVTWENSPVKVTLNLLEWPEQKD